jgi:hypothetical protein
MTEEASMTRRQVMTAALTIVLAAGAVSANTKFLSTWKAPGLPPQSFGGQTVVALVISDDMSLRMSTEEAMSQELTRRGVKGVAAYRVIPTPELKDPQKAKGWFEKAGARGVVVMRLIDIRKEQDKAPVVWNSYPYNSFWDYYPYSWSSTIIIVNAPDDTKVTVETVVYDLAHNRLLWSGTSESSNPKGARSLVEGIIDSTAEEMKKEGLIAK